MEKEKGERMLVLGCVMIISLVASQPAREFLYKHVAHHPFGCLLTIKSTYHLSSPKSCFESYAS